MMIVVVEKKERRHVKAAGVQVILPKMFQHQVAGPHKSHDQSMPLGQLPDVGTFWVISLAPQPLSHAFCYEFHFFLTVQHFSCTALFFLSRFYMTRSDSCGCATIMHDSYGLLVTRFLSRTDQYS